MRNTQPLVQPQPAAKRCYATPQLTAYGLVRELTAGGSGGNAEVSPPNGNNKMRKA